MKPHTTKPVSTPDMALEKYYWSVFYAATKPTPDADDMYARAITALDGWHGRKVTLRELADSLLTRWETHERYHTAIRSIWRHAEVAGLARPIGHEKPSAEWTVRAYFWLAYMLARPLRAPYQYDRCIRRLNEFAGHAVRLSELSDELLSTWVMSMEQAEVAPRTIKSSRMNVLCVWRHAKKRRIIPGPEDIRDVRIPRKIPRAWTLEEFRRILKACENRRSYLANGIPEWLYFRALLCVAYETGLRKGDLLRLSLDDIGADGTIATLQGKTLEGHVTSVSEETLKLLREIADRVKHDGHEHWQLPLHWPYSGDGTRYLYAVIKAIRDAAGVEGLGALQQIRRTGATYCEAAMPGSASRYLGHKSTDLAYRFYVDRRKLGPAPRPPALTLQAEGGES